MPLYEYKCDACGHRFEVIRKFSDPPVDVCPKCGGTVQKLISAPAFQLKGTGWYATDYAKKDSGAGGKQEAESKADAASKDAKAEQPGKSDPSDKGEKTDKGESSEKVVKSPKTEGATSSTGSAASESGGSSSTTSPSPGATGPKSESRP